MNKDLNRELNILFGTKLSEFVSSEIEPRTLYTCEEGMVPHPDGGVQAVTHVKMQVLVDLVRGLLAQAWDDGQIAGGVNEHEYRDRRIMRNPYQR